MKVSSHRPDYKHIDYSLTVFKTLLYMVQVLSTNDSYLTWKFQVCFPANSQINLPVVVVTRKTARGIAEIVVAETSQTAADMRLQSAISALELLDRHQVAASTKMMWAQRWNTFGKIFMLVHAIQELGEVSWEPGCRNNAENGIERRPWINKNNALIWAREALENRDDKALQEMFHDLAHSWRFAHTRTPIYAVATQPLHTPISKHAVEMLAHRGFGTGFFRAWPDRPDSVPFPWHSCEVEDFIYATALVNGSKMYRLITPQNTSLVVDRVITVD